MELLQCIADGHLLPRTEVILLLMYVYIYAIETLLFLTKRPDENYRSS